MNRTDASLKTRRGFSVLELLIVVAVIGTLAMIILAGVQSARERSAAARCAGNLRQLSAAGLNWIADHNGSLPDRSYWSLTLQGKSRDSFSLFPYLGLPQGNENVDTVLTCPTLKAKYRPFNLAESVTASWHRTYGMNMYTMGSISLKTDHPDLVFSYLRLPNVPHPSKTAFFFDGPITPMGNGIAAYANRFQYPELRPVGPGDREIRGTDYIHSGAINVVFLDGHVETITHERVVRENLTDRSLPFWGRKP
ncbi:MAG TPA: prepilin-type N-terminal cleavage/methylation domain-containing protein [Chthoniobacteraceae bacterium]|nr:prepilin-type N-terminal cleavage/methylation domain-containing protein [Chthoniobacteraceae bacterium]